MEVHIRAVAHGFCVSPSPSDEEQKELWDAVAAITLHDDEQTIALTVERVKPPPTYGSYMLLELFQAVHVWIGTPLGAGTLVKIVDKVLEVVVHWAKTLNNGKGALTKVITIYGPDGVDPRFETTG